MTDMWQDSDIALDMPEGKVENQKYDDRANLLPGDTSTTNGNSTAYSGSKSGFLSFDFYQSLFDVDTDTVYNRLRSSIIPRKNFNFIDSVLRSARRKNNGPDMYGPFWICVTLVFSTAICGNLANFIHRNGDPYWNYSPEFDKVSMVATSVFGYAYFLPVVIYFFIKYKVNGSGSNSNSGSLDNSPDYRFMEILCTYGYSLFVYIPISVLWVLPFESFRWILVLVGAGVSGSMLAQALYPTVKYQSKKQLVYILLGLILVSNLALAVGFKKYLFETEEVANANFIKTYEEVEAPVESFAEKLVASEQQQQEQQQQNLPETDVAADDNNNNQEEIADALSNNEEFERSERSQEVAEDQVEIQNEQTNVQIQDTQEDNSQVLTQNENLVPQDNVQNDNAENLGAVNSDESPPNADYQFNPIPDQTLDENEDASPAMAVVQNPEDNENQNNLVINEISDSVDFQSNEQQIAEPVEIEQQPALSEDAQQDAQAALWEAYYKEHPEMRPAPPSVPVAVPAQPAQPLNVIQQQPQVPQGFATVEQNSVPIQQNNFVPQNIAAEQYPNNQQYIQQQAAQPVYQQAAVPVNQVQIGAQPTATRAYQQQFVPQ